jgi:hypothetical protein
MLPTDFYVLKPWLFAKLNKRWPAITDRTFAAWLSTYVADNAHCAFITDDAVAVALKQSDIRDPVNCVELLWVVHNAGHSQEAFACIRACAEWAKRQGCAEFRFGEEGDIPLKDVASALGVTKRRTIHYMPLGAK